MPPPINGTCPKSSYFDDSKSQCVPCMQGCSQCSSNDNCTMCASTYYKLRNATTMIDSCVYLRCPEGYLTSNRDNMCQACSKNCRMCITPNTCWTCQEGYYKTTQGCKDSCPPGYYFTLDNIHQYYQCVNKCPANCLKCRSRGTCDQCEADYNLVSSSN